MEKIILFYKFVPLKDPEAVRLWQKTLCEELDLKGRILVSEKGINGTLGGNLKNLKAYVRDTKAYSAFKGMEFKWSEGKSSDFPKLSVKVRSETVTLGWDPAVDERGVRGGGKHLKPHEVNEFVAKNPDTIFFDGRNNYESAIGKFKNAVTPNVRTFKQMPTELDKPEYQKLKDKPVITYCTGGIRCETLSALMKEKGFEQVYQIDGGIVKYGEKYGDDGLWEGKCFVFDKRLQLSFSENANDIGECVHCAGKTSRYINCDNKACNELILVCVSCSQQTFCSNCTEKLTPV
jgi:UPF0176 protein